LLVGTAGFDASSLSLALQRCALRDHWTASLADVIAVRPPNVTLNLKAIFSETESSERATRICRKTAG